MKIIKFYSAVAFQVHIFCFCLQLLIEKLKKALIFQRTNDNHFKFNYICFSVADNVPACFSTKLTM